MSKADKLREKLKRGTIDARELRTLLKKLGWQKDRQDGSHETWARGRQTFTLATHGQDLKRYQIKDAQELLNEEEKEETKKSE